MGPGSSHVVSGVGSPFGIFTAEFDQESVIMNPQYGRGYPPTPAEIMERLENSMAEIDQMMAELRGSIMTTPVAGLNQPRNPTQTMPPQSTPMDGFAQPPQFQEPPNVNTQGATYHSPGLPSRYLQPEPELGYETAPPAPPPAPYSGCRSEKSRMVPDRFDGRTPVLDYLSHFEACCEVNRWSKEEATQYLAASLRGSAVKLLTQQTGRRLTYDELVDRLKRRYGPGGKADVFLAELRQRRRGPKETIQELGQTIRDLTVLAYPDFDEDGQDRLARGHFLDAIMDARIREGLFRAQPRTLDEAIEAARNVEAFIKMEGGRRENRPTGYTRAAVEERPRPNDPTYRRLEEAVNELISRAESRIQHMLNQRMEPHIKN